MIYSRKNKRDGFRYWFIRYTLPDGRRKREKVGTDKQEARDLLVKRKAAILNGTYVNPREARDEHGPTFNEFADRFMREYGSLRRSDHYTDRLKRLREQFGDMALRDITLADLDRFAAARARQVSPSTVRKDLAVVTTMFKKAVQWGVLDASPAVGLTKPRPPQHKTRYLSRDEWKRLRDSAPPWLRPMLVMAVATGMRLKEVVGLRWDDVDRENALVHVSADNKTGRTRAIPIGETTRSLLKDLVRHVRVPYVFNDSTGTPYTSPKARDRITKATIAAMKAADIPDASFHTLRHTAASFMVQAGTPLFEVQKILGHSTPLMTERYAHLQPDHLRGGIAAIDTALQEGLISDSTQDAASEADSPAASKSPS